MASRFVVRSSDTSPPGKVPNFVAKWLVPIAAATAASVLLKYQYPDLTRGAHSRRPASDTSAAVTAAFVSASLILCFLLAGLIAPTGSRAQHEVEVEITPLGVQISTFRGSSAAAGDDSEGTRIRSRIGVPTFLPRESVLDAVVSEVVLSYRVSSAVVFRVRDDDASDDSRRPHDNGNVSSIEDMMTAGAVRLVRAFPGMEMTYLQCLEVWEGIMIALGGEEEEELDYDELR